MNNGTAENMGFTKKEELTEEALSVMAEEYPYYPIAQFKLLSEYKKNKNKNFEKQSLVTALFFNNNRWLNKQLYQQTAIENKYDEDEEIDNSNTIVSEQSESAVAEILSKET